MIKLLPLLCAAVLYRGIFVNDEDWSLRPWAIKHYGKQQQIGVRAYTDIFSLMRADGLNLLWPAMHEGGYEFSERPENFELARRYGIALGTSHCEPMMRNNCYLPKADRRKWSWLTGKDFLLDYWREGVKRGSDNDILWTVGMRGIHDGKMPDGKTTAKKCQILEEVIAAQRSLLPEGAQTLFVPYKEVLPIYNSGMKVPDDTIIMWTNDNFGYVRRLGGDGRRQGIYWHISYHGRPHGYIHLCTTPPAFMWYELVAKCWNNGVRDVWMVNAGDVFQAEILLACYGKIANDPDAFGPDTQPKLLKEWANNLLDGKDDGLADKIACHLKEYYNLGFNRKPEHMCVYWTENLPPTVKAELLRRYHALLETDLAIDREVAEKFGNAAADAYFRAAGFQARFLAYAGIIHLEDKDQNFAKSVLNPLHERWNKMEGGKWSGFWRDTIDEQGGARQPTTSNRWSSQMQWPWNEPVDPDQASDRGVPRSSYPATAYRAEVEEPEWLEPVSISDANGGTWQRIEGLGTSGNALALYPVKPGIGTGATIFFDKPEKTKTLVLQFLPDFALWPGLKLGVDVDFGNGKKQYVQVPRSDSNIGEHDPIRNRAVQDNFIRVEIPVPENATIIKIVAADPGVVIDRIGVR
ncbi:MAG: glycosyl hydrolase 115 family protein [Kiritimatiellae bacterium]|nr:glycosyl hydrolase 115 family protein [Kiritimatiellia bacterium]